MTALLTACSTVKIEERDAFDRKRTVEPEALRARGVEITDRRLSVQEGVALHARRYHRPESRGTILVYGGNGFLMVTAHDLLEALLALHVDVVMFDYRGYGQSGGEPSVAALKADALAVHDWVTGELGVPPERLVLHGHSMGTLVATWAAEQRGAAAVVMESPVTDIEDLTDRMTPWIADLFVSFEIDPALSAERNGPRVAALDVPLLLLVGEEDNVTPRSSSDGDGRRSRP